MTERAIELGNAIIDDCVTTIEMHLEASSRHGKYELLRRLLINNATRCLCHIHLYHPDIVAMFDRWTFQIIFPISDDAMLASLIALLHKLGWLWNVDCVYVCMYAGYMQHAQWLIDRGYPVTSGKRFLTQRMIDKMIELRFYAETNHAKRERCRRAAATIMRAKNVARDVRRIIAIMLWNENQLHESWNYRAAKRRK